MQYFFKIFFVAVLFSVYHGIIFLPVLLRFETPAIMSCEKFTRTDENNENNANNHGNHQLENSSSIELNVT